MALLGVRKAQAGVCVYVVVLWSISHRMQTRLLLITVYVVSLWDLSVLPAQAGSVHHIMVCVCLCERHQQRDSNYFPHY